MPPELVAYAKEHDIQLLTHNDPPSKKNNFLINVTVYMVHVLILRVSPWMINN